jgi:hypothetical protein
MSLGNPCAGGRKEKGREGGREGGRTYLVVE